MKKRLIALGLTAVLLAGMFAGCEKEKKPEPGQESDPAATSKYAYKPAYTSLTTGDTGLNMTYVRGMEVIGDTAYYIGMCEMGQQEEKDEITGEPILDETGKPFMRTVTEGVLFSLNTADGTVKRVEGYQQSQPPEGWRGNCRPVDLAACEDGSLWIVENHYFYQYELPEGFDPETGNPYEYRKEKDNVVCRQILPDGTAGKELLLERGEDPLQQVKIMSDGTIYSTDLSNVYLHDEAGKIIKTAAMESVGGLLEISNHELAVTVWDENGQRLRILNGDTMSFGEPVSLPRLANSLMDCAGEYDFLFENSGRLYGATMTGEPEKLLSWMDSDVDPGTINRDIETTPDGKIYAISEGETGRMELVSMTPVDPSTLPERQILTMACMFIPWDIRSDIVEFNKSQDKIRITLKDYSEFGTEENPDGGIQKLNTEMVSGAIPDMFYFDSSMPVEVYGAKGFLMDLWPLIDSDKELKREDLMTNFFDALSQDGKLYQITDRFAIATAAGVRDVVGSAPAWNLQELMSAYQQLGPEATIFGQMDTKEGILHTCVDRNLNAFIDWENKVCRFDSQEFADLLEFADTFPAEFDEENFDWNTYESNEARIMARKQLLSMENLSSFDRVMTLNEALQGKISYIGYPTMDHNGSTFEYYNGLAIGAQCKNTEAAWSFIRQYLTEDHHKQADGDAYIMNGAGRTDGSEEDQCRYNIWYFATNKKVFDEVARYHMTEHYYTDPETGEKTINPIAYYWPDHGSEGIPINSMSQEAYDGFMELYNRTEMVRAYNQEVSDIILQECKAFFAGQKSAQETAKLIQDRVSLYVMEQA